MPGTSGVSQPRATDQPGTRRLGRDERTGKAQLSCCARVWACPTANAI